jgi:hypothetical protein
MRSPSADLLDRALALSAFEAGFAAGADPRRARRRTVVEPLTHQHWRRGFEAGRDAAFRAAKSYRAELAAASDRSTP